MGHLCLCAPCQPHWCLHLPGAEEPRQGCRKPSTQEITSTRGCAGAGCSQIPLQQRSGRHSGCKPSGRLQHSTNGALTVGDSCSEDTKTQLSSSHGCAHLALPPSRCFLPLSAIEKAQPGYPNLSHHQSRSGDADVPPSPALLPPAVPRQSSPACRVVQCTSIASSPYGRTRCILIYCLFG